MTNTKARDEAIPDMYVTNERTAFKTGYDTCLEHVLKAVGIFDDKEAWEIAYKWIDQYFDRDHEYYMLFHGFLVYGLRHQHDQIIKKIKGETK